MNVTLKLQKWGNSSGVRLPKKVIDAAKLDDNQEFTVVIQDGSILLTPIKPHQEFTLEHMLQGVTPEMVGGEIYWGPDVGKEIIEY